MVKRLYLSYMYLDRRDKMIYGIAIAAMVVMFSGGLADILRDRRVQAVVQCGMGAIALLLLIHYYLHKHYAVFAYVGIATVIVGYDLLLYFDHFVLHSYLILMVIPLVIFFILPLRQALTVSIIHYLLLVSISYYGYAVLDIDSSIFEKDALQVYIFGALFILAFGSVYQFAIEDSYCKLQEANTQKALLLKEIHHRIKNNLNKMSSALGLQILRARNGHCEDAEEILRKNKLRIEAMALVHEALYRSKDIANVAVDSYIRDLAQLIERAYGCAHSMTVVADYGTLAPDEILRIGTIFNELYTNSIKHSRHCHDIDITVQFIKQKTVCKLCYTQKGHAEVVEKKKLQESSGFGMMLVRLSAEEMGGELVIRSQENALVFEVLFAC